MKLSDCPSCISSSPSEFDDDDDESDRVSDSDFSGSVYSRFYLLPSTRAWGELTKVFFRRKPKAKNIESSSDQQRVLVQPSGRKDYAAKKDKLSKDHHVNRKFIIERKHKIKKRDLVRGRVLPENSIKGHIKPKDTQKFITEFSPTKYSTSEPPRSRRSYQEDTSRYAKIDPSEVERRQSSQTTAEIKVISKTGLILSSVQSTGTPASGAVLQQQQPHDHPDQQQHDEVGHEAREDREKTPTTQPAQRTQTPPTPTSPGAESSSSSSESDTLKEESPDKQFIDDSPSIESNQNTSDDITNVSSEAINISSSSTGSSEERDSNLLICDNKSASSTPAVADGVPAIVAVEHHTEIKRITAVGDPGTSSLRIPIKLPVVQEVITTLYSYRVESPKPTTLKPLVVKKSRSLDDDEFMIQEISDASSTSELTDNQPLVSEAESEADSESAEMLEMEDSGILSVQTLPLDSDEEAVKTQEYTSSSCGDKEDVSKPAQNQEARELKAQRARKRAAIETHFMPQFINPRYLDSIKEENSDTSDIDRKNDSGDRKRKPIEASSSSSLFDDLEDDVFIDGEAISKKANAVFPKSNLDFSQRKKHISNLRAPKTGIIREEPACIIVEAKIVESMEAVEESCSTWTTNNIPESDTAEVVYIESTSSSSSDVMETEDGGADIDDGAEELDVRIETPTIDVDSEIFPSSSSTSSATPTQNNDDGMLIEIKHQQPEERLIEADNASVAETASAAAKEIVEEPAASEVFVGESVATAAETLPPPVCCGDQSTSLGKNISDDAEGKTISRRENFSELSESSFPSTSQLLTTATSEQNRQSSETAVDIEPKQSTVFAIINNSDQQNNIISDAIDINDTSFSSISNILSNSSDIIIPSSNDNTNSSNSSEVIENLPDFRIGEPCSNNMFATLISPLIGDQSSHKLDNLISADNGHTENVNISSSAIKELVRQDSGGSHGSGHSQSTILTQCTAINKTRSSPNNADLADFDVGPCVSGSSTEFNRQSPDIGEQPIQSLRQICLNSLSSMPYGKVVLEELASVAESLSDLTQKHQEAKAATFATTEMPYPVPDLPRIEDLVVPVNSTSNISNNEARKPMTVTMFEAVPPHPPPPRSSQIKIMSLPPQKLNSPPPPPVPAPPKMESWLGMPTEQDPNVLVCFSPSQRNYMQETKAGTEPSPDNLLDMHKKFVERRGYHEMTMDQVEAINRGKAQHQFHDPSASTGVPSSLLRSQSKQSPPPPPPPPLPRSFSESAADGGFGDYIGSSTTNTSIGDQNNHRLLAIIRDSQQQSSVSENTHNKVDQVKKSQCSAVPKDRRSDQGSQTEPAFTSKSRPSAPQSAATPPVDPFGAKSSTETAAPRNSKMPQVSFDKDNFFNFDRHNDEDFFKSGAKRFSNIESSTTTPSFCSQLRQTMPKRYSNIETSSYESKKRIENGNVVYDYCDSNKQKYSNADDDKKADAHHTNGNSGQHQHQQDHKQQQQQPHSQHQQNERQKQFTRSNIMSDANLDANGGARPTESSTDFTNFKNRFFSGDNKSNSQNEFTYDEFRERAKESARRARSEFFDRDNHLFKDFDGDVSKFFKDDAFAKRSTSGTEKKENRETTSSKTFTIPIKVEGGKERKDASTSNTSQYQQFEKSSMSKSVPNLDRSGSGKVHHIPINIESGYKKPKEPKTKEEPIYVNQQELFKRSFSNEPKPNETRQDQFNRSISTDQKMTEKRLSSQNLDEWMRYADDLGASSDNITRPFQREVDICRGRRVNVRAPRLTASTNDLCNTNDPYAYHDPYSLESKRCQFPSSNSMIDRTPISSCIASKRSPHHDTQNQQFDYLKQKELELQAEFERLENDRRRLIEELEGRHGSNSLRKDVFHHQSCRLPTLSEEEAFRQQMQNEWLNKVAEREERRMQKIIKISKPGDDHSSGPEVPDRAVRKSSSTADISDEFLRRVKERRSKLQMPSDSDWESGAESQPAPVRNESNPENVPRVKVFEGQSEKDFKNLPQHLREFAEYVTTTTSTKTETKTDECESSTNTMSTVQQAAGTKKDGVWSPNSKTTETQKTSSTTRTSGGGSGPGTGTKAPPTPPPPPVWSPQPSPTPGRKEFRPVKFESPTPTRKYIIRQESEPALPPWSYIDSRPFPGYQSTSCSNLNSVGPTRPTLTKAHSSSTFQQQGKGASYIENERPKIPKDNTPAFVRPNEVIYSLKNEYLSEPESENEQPKKMAQLGRRKFDGIGPTTKDGMPLVLRSEVKENNQHKWYKRMYNTLHRAKDDDEYVTIRYKTYRGRYPYKTNGYMSEPEPNYDSDYATMKYKTLDRRRIPSTGSYPEERNYGTMPNPVKPGSGSYKNQPGRIENYTPGRSSVSEKEKKEWWDEVMDIFNGWLEDNSSLPKFYFTFDREVQKFHLEQQKLSNNYTEGYLSRALKEQGYESDTNLVFRKKEESQFAPLSPVEQKQAYRTVQAGGEPPLQGFRKPAPERPKDDSEIEYYPITSTLTKIRVPNKNALPLPQKEIICYPITNISRPLDLFAPFPKNVPSFIPISPPPPPSRISSRTSAALKVFSHVTAETKKAVAGSRHEACFHSDYYQSEIPANKYGTITIRKHSKREPVVRSKSTGAVSSSKVVSSSALKEERSRDSGTRISRRHQLYRVSSVSPARPSSRLADLRKSSPSPVAFGRSISKERTFAEERKRLQEVLPLCRKHFTASTNILRDPSLKSPEQVKRAVRSSFLIPLMRSKSAPKQLSPLSYCHRPSSTFLTASAKRNTTGIGKKEEKSLKVALASTSKGRDSFKASAVTTKSTSHSPSVLKSNIRSSRVVEKKTPKSTTKTSSTLSLARTNSTYSIDSTGSKRRTESKKPITITRSTSRDYTAPLTLSGKGKKKKSSSKERLIPISKSDSNVRSKIESAIEASRPQPIVETIEKQIRKDLNEAILQHQETVRSDNFFQNLFLRDTSPVPSIASSSFQSTSVQEKAKFWDAITTKSEPVLRRSSVYLSQKRPVSDSKFLAMESKHFHQSRSLSPVARPISSRIADSICKFDSLYHLSDEESEFGDKRAEALQYKYEQRSSSEPRARTYLTEIIHPDSPTVIHGRKSLEYDDVRSFTPTREVRSPSRRRIQSFRDQKAETRKVVRASSLSSADQRSRRSLYECGDISHSTSSLSYIERHGPICRHRNSDRFKELNRFYSNVERVGQLERATSSTDLRPIRKDGEIIDFDEWRQVRAHERAEKELKYLVGKLKRDQREKDLLFRPKDVEDVKWLEEWDSGLRNKEKSVEDLRETFERKHYEEGLDAAKKHEIESLKDTYKPFWRGNSVVDLASSMVVKYNPPESGAPKQAKERRICLSNRLISTLSKDQISKIKNQLNEIYSSGPGSSQKDKADAVLEDYIITVDDQNKTNVNSLKVRCNSSISKEELLGSVLKRKEAQMTAAIRSEASTSTSPHIPLPPRPPPQSKSFERVSRQVSRYSTELSEGEKRRLSQSLSREIYDKVQERKNRTSSPITPRETRGAIAAENAKNSMAEAPPQQYYSLEYSRSKVRSPTTSRDASVEKVTEKKTVRTRRSSFGESESNASDISKTTVIYKEKPVECIQHKIKYFEEKKEEEPPKTIYHAREYSSPDEEEILKAIEEKIKAKEREAEKITLRHQELSSSLSDFKELFGEKESTRVNFPLPRPPPPPDKPVVHTTTRFRSSSLSLSNSSSYESLYRSRSASPASERINRMYLRTVRTGDVKKIKDKFENLNACSRINFIELSPIRRIRSDPELNKCLVRDQQRSAQHKVTVRDHESGDVSWITHKFEVKGNAAGRGRSRTRKVISPLPRRKDDRLMPHIDIISKTAALKREIRKSQSPTTSSSARQQAILHSGEVERIRCKFESPDRTSLLGQMYTSSPDISELKDISSYLSGSWIAHKYPKPRDNARSPVCPEKGPESEKIKRREFSRPSSASPPRAKTLVSSILRPYYDIFADQKFDPLKHRPKARYVPDKADHLWKKQNGYKRTGVKFEENDVPPPPPLKGVTFNGNGLSPESPRRYIESDVNIHYKSPIRYEFKDAIAEDELARRQAETMKKLYQEERRRKYLQELQDMNSRRHTDNFTQSQKSPISLNRYDDFGTDLSPKSPNVTSGSVPSRTIARALYNFQGQTARELTFKKGDVIYIRRQIDKNWYEGEHNAMVGLLPANYVEIISKDGTRLPSRKASEGQARAKFNFSAQSAIELSLNKGELVTLTRRVDDNWFEGKIANRKGIFPVSYVEVLTDIGAEENFCQTTVKPVGAPASHSLITYPNTTPSLDTMRTNLNNEFNTLTNGHPTNGILRETKQVHKTEVLHVDTNTEPIPYRALYKYRPQNTDELELQEGDIVYVLEKCDDGWYVGTSSRTGYFGTFPGNYVERM